MSPTGATTKGKLIVLNQHYKTIDTLKAKSPWEISLHDASFVPGTPDVWVTAYRQVKNQNLTKFGGSRHGDVYDVAVQEYNLATKKLVKSWSAFNPGHKSNVSLSESHQPAPKNGSLWDAYHLNAVQVTGNGDLLISMRNTWAVYLVNPKTGKIIWTLGGKKSFFNFASKRPLRLAARRPDAGQWGRDAVQRQLHGWDPRARVPRRPPVVRDGPEAQRGQAQGHAGQGLHPQPAAPYRVPGQHASVGQGAARSWASARFRTYSEYSASGKQILDVKWPGKDETYRARYTGDWVGTPLYPPNGAAKTSGGKTKVYA